MSSNDEEVRAKVPHWDLTSPGFQRFLLWRLAQINLEVSHKGNNPNQTALFPDVHCSCFLINTGVLNSGVLVWFYLDPFLVSELQRTDNDTNKVD